MPKVVRSPNYPTINLEEAVRRTQVIYKKEVMHPASREVLAKDIGYGSLNGASASILSALSKYGLLEAAGTDQFRVSKDALDIILHHPGDPERIAAIRRAALKPALFSELHDMYGEKPPSEHNLSATLQKRGFNPNTVAGVIRSYRDTMEFVAAESVSSNVENVAEQGAEMPLEPPPTRGPAAPATAPAIDFTELLKGIVQQQATMRGDQPASPISTLTSPQADPDKVEQELRFKLTGDAEVRVVFRGSVTQEAIEMFRDLLGISKRGFPTEASIQARTADEGGDPNSL